MIPVLATILYFSLALLSPPEELSSYLAVATWWYIFVEIVLTIFFATLYSETNIILSNYLDQKIRPI